MPWFRLGAFTYFRHACPLARSIATFGDLFLRSGTKPVLKSIWRFDLEMDTAHPQRRSVSLPALPLPSNKATSCTSIF
jgi:hypothetical protein